MGVLGVELHKRHEGVGPVGLLVGEEGVEAADDVGGDRLHRAGAVEDEVDVEVLGVGHLLFLRFGGEAARPRSKTSRIVSLIARPCSLPTSASLRSRSSGRRTLTRPLVVFRLARDGATKYCEGVTRSDIGQEYYIV